jgi:hypothetical protein
VVIHDRRLTLPQSVPQGVYRRDRRSDTIFDRQAITLLGFPYRVSLPREGVALCAEGVEAFRQFGHEAFREEGDSSDALDYLLVEVADPPLDCSRVGGRALLPLGVDEPLEAGLQGTETSGREQVLL